MESPSEYFDGDFSMLQLAANVLITLKHKHLCIEYMPLVIDILFTGLSASVTFFIIQNSDSA